MERLNNDTIAYQTVHSAYTYTLGIKDNPKQGGIGFINRDDYNVYSVEMYQDSLVFFINETRTFAYPRIETDKEGQFPFTDKKVLSVARHAVRRKLGRSSRFIGSACRDGDRLGAFLSEEENEKGGGGYSDKIGQLGDDRLF